MNLPEFQTWLTKGQTEEEAFCKLCKVTIKAGKSELKKHSNGQKHKKKVEEFDNIQKSVPKIDNFVTLNTKVKNAEAALCSYIVENDLPISSIEPLVDLIKNLPEKNVIDKIAVAKQKATNVIRSGLRPFFNEQLVEKLRTNFYSIYIDETTDVSVSKQLAIVVTYCENLQTQVDVLDVVDCPDGSAISLYNNLIKCMEQNNVPFHNWVGFCSDTTNVMMGEHNSVSQLIKKNFPNVFISKCSCHMIALVASNACSKLSNSLEDLCRNIYNHFNRSPKSSAAYKEFQAFFEVKPHKLLKLVQTRWLSLQECSRRILEQWDALLQYWLVLCQEDPTHANCHTLQTLENPLLRCLMYFAEYSLGLFNDYNCFFQADHPQFVELKKKTEELIQSLALNFMKSSYVKNTPALAIDPHLEEQHVLLKEVYLGINATDLLLNTENKKESEVEKLILSAKMFYIEAIVQIKKRFVFESIHDDASFLEPNNASNLNPTSLINIVKKYLPKHCEVDLSELDKEWRKQCLLSPKEQDVDVPTYWRKMFNHKDHGSHFKFLPLLVNFFFSLPFSNAVTERMFSTLKNIKTEKRNRLDNETLSSILCVKYGMKRTKLSSTDLMKKKIKIPHLKNVHSNATSGE